MRVRTIAVVSALSVVLGAGLAAAADPVAEKAPAPKAAPAAAAAPAPAAGSASKEVLKNPAVFKEKAPDTFRVKFETSKGDFVVEATRAWSPEGVDRFYNLVKNGFFDDVRFFRVVPNFVVQFGIHGDPAVSAAWRSANIPDEPVKESNKQMYMTYAKGGPNTRTTQIFINLKDNANLDSMGFPPFAKVVKGSEVVEKLNGEYGETLTSLQGQIQQQGNAFLAQKAPKLDYIKTARIAK